MNKQIEEIKELTNELVFTSNYGTYNAVAEYLHNKGYRKSTDVARAVIDEINNAVPVKDFNSNEITTGYLWAIADVRKLLLKLKKKYESEGAE